MKTKFNLKDSSEDFKNLKVYQYKKGKIKNVFSFKSELDMMKFLVKNS